MDQNSLKTSTRTRVIIAIIAILLLGSTIAAYAGVIVSGSKSTDIASLKTKYDEAEAEVNEYALGLSAKYFDTFNGYRSDVKAFNAEAANSEGVKTNDLSQGSGRELATGDLEYLAYYIGFCPNGVIFDSSFNDNENPTSLNPPLYPASLGLIQGWNEGVVGMKIGGTREIQIPAELAYGDTNEQINSKCGINNPPLKFIVMTIDENTQTYMEKMNKYNEAYTAFAQAYSKMQSQQQSQQQTQQTQQSTDSSSQQSTDATTIQTAQ